MIPVFPEQVAASVRSIGIRGGETLMVHASMRAIGPVVGGATALLLALEEAVGVSGTLVTPSQSWQLCDPGYLADPGLPAALHPQVRQALPPFDREWTPSRTMGAVAEALRTQPGTLRSDHPHRSFVARGPAAAGVVARHDLDDPVGEGSPLAALYEMDAQVLLLGVGYDKCTALHLAEARSGLPTWRVANGAPLMVERHREWVSFTEPAVDDSDFAAVGAAFAEAGGEAVGSIGAATARLISMREIVDFASRWMASNRQSTVPGRTP